MEIRIDTLLLLLGAGLVTFIPRVLPLMILSRLALPEWAMRWLSFVPISVMAALVAQELLLHEGKLSLQDNSIPLIAALPTIAAALWKRSLLITVLVGVISVMLLRMIL